MRTVNIDKIVKAIEADAGKKLPGLRESLAEMEAGKQGRVHTSEQLILRAARDRLDVSQSEFAKMIHTPVATLRDWEQGRYPPPGCAVRLAQIAFDHPEILENISIDNSSI